MASRAADARSSVRRRELALPTTLPSGLVLLAAILACVSWTLHAGPEWSWDRMHYHEYAGWQVLEGALGRGFMPAGGQTYLNPVAYLPAHLLARAGVGELGVSVALAALQAGCVWAVWRVSRRALAGVGPDVDRYAAAAAVLAFLTPVFLLEVGASYIDATTTLPLLAGVAFALRALEPRHAGRWALAAGLAFGLAAGLKLSNALPAVAGTVLVLWAVGLRAMPGRLLCYLAGGVLGTALGHGWWSAQLWAEFGNPLYPMLGGVFGTPPVPVPLPVTQAVELAGTAAAAVAPAAGDGGVFGLLRASGGRFTPRDLADWLDFPLRVANPTLSPSFAYIESRQPDPRLLALAALAAAAAVATAWRRLRGGVCTRAAPAARAPSAVAALSVFWGLWYVGWTLSSSNARYAIGLLMLASPLLVGAVAVAWRVPLHRARVLTALVAVQAAWALGVADPRSLPVPRSWQDNMLRLEVPAALSATPVLHVTRQAMSWSVLASRLHPQSAFANLGAVCESCGNRRDADEARRVLQAWYGRARLLDPVLSVVDGVPVIAAAQRAGIDAWLAPYDLRVELSGCEFVAIAPNPSGVRMQVSAADGSWSTRSADRLASCPIVAAPGASERLRAMSSRVDDVFEALEARCGAQLGRPPVATRWLGNGVWTRTYAQSAQDVVVSGDRVVATGETGASTALGSLTTLREGGTAIDCAALAPTHRDVARRAAAPRAPVDAAALLDRLVSPPPAAR
jgi:hypothetical protein